MRLFMLLLAGSILGCAAGCRTQPTSVAAGGPAMETDPVGPVPGAVHDLHYRTNPFVNDPVALQDGRRLFDWYNCSGCHGGHAGGGMGPSLRDADWLYGDRPDQIYNSISQGRSKGMPAWGTKIPEQQIWELVTYIKSVGTPEEPDPPIEPTEEEVPNPDNNTVLGVGPKASVPGRR
jgi:cytochrome c oxidase cbb3-type subunit III